MMTCRKEKKKKNKEMPTHMHTHPKVHETYTILLMKDCEYLFEPDNIWMPQGPVIYDFPLNILINLKSKEPKQN